MCACPAQHPSPWQARGLLATAEVLRLAGGVAQASAAIVSRPVLCHIFETTALFATRYVLDFSLGPGCTCGDIKR